MERKLYICLAAVMALLIMLVFVTKGAADRAYEEEQQAAQAAEEKKRHALLASASNEADALIRLGDDMIVRAQGDYMYTLEDEETVDKYRAKDTVFTYRVEAADVYVGALTITVRHVDRGDQLVFAQFLAATKSDVTIPLQLVTTSDGFEELRFDDIDFIREHDTTFGVNKLTNLAGVFRFDDQPYEVVASQNFISHELVKQYEDGDTSTVRELVAEVRAVKIEQQNEEAVVHMPLKGKHGEISENWFVLGVEKLFTDDETAMYYRGHTELYHIRSHFWLNASGAYTKLPWSIEPSTRDGYGRNLLHQRSKVSLEELQKEDSRFHYAMLINSVNYLLDRKIEGQLWETEYTSTWLQRDYGIRAPYTDTRHNENIALFLTEVGDYLHDLMLQNMYFEYADYLSNQVNIDNVLATENGYFILDYYGKTLTKKTHVSLNHALGEMNFLLRAYARQPNQQYMNTAIAIKQAIEDTATQWIRDDNSDFWYQINGDYTFSGADYENLTLEDLLNTLTIYKQLGLKYDPVLYATMIGHKVGYLQQAEIPMSKSLLQALDKQGYSFLLTQDDALPLAQ